MARFKATLATGAVAASLLAGPVAAYPIDCAILLCLAGGTGLAPFRGFIQDRALRAQADGVTPAPALLFFGCDGPDIDYLYRDELEEWQRQGVVDVRPAFSAEPEDGPDGPMRFVQDRLWADRADVAELVRSGAQFYVCGEGQRIWCEPRDDQGEPRLLTLRQEAPRRGSDHPLAIVRDARARDESGVEVDAAARFDGIHVQRNESGHEFMRRRSL